MLGQKRIPNPHGAEDKTKFMPRKRKTDRVEVFRTMRIPVQVIASQETVRNCLAIIEQLVPHMREDRQALINLGDDLDKIKADILEQL